MIWGDLKKNIFSNPKGGSLCFQKQKSAMTNKIKKFLYILEHLIQDGHNEIPTFAIYHHIDHVPSRIPTHNQYIGHKI